MVDKYQCQADLSTCICTENSNSNDDVNERIDNYSSNHQPTSSPKRNTKYFEGNLSVYLFIFIIIFQ